MKYGRSLQELAIELDRQAKVKKDYVATAGAMQMTAVNENFDLVIGNTPFQLNENAHRQLGLQLKIPAPYYERMRAENPGLLMANVNGWFQQSPDTRRMVRTLDGTARAILSDRYRRIDNYEVAQTVLPIISEMQGARIESCELTDVSINTVKSWRKRYWTQGADAPAKRTLHPEDAPAAPDPETRPKQGAPPGNVNAVGAGAPKGNRNAVKHGGWSELMFRSWTEEHRQLLDACDEDVDAEELLINELKLLTAREGYLLERISHYSKEGAYVQTQTTSKRSRNFKRLDGDTEKEKNDLQAYVEAIDAKVVAGERLPGNETLTNSTLEASYLIIERLNKLLTDVQRQKAQCIKQLAELRNMSGGGKSELVDDWVAAIQAAEGMDDDTP